MMIEKIEIRRKIDSNRKLVKAYNKMQKLTDALNKKELTSEVIGYVNEQISLINSFKGSEKDLIKILKNSYTQILKFVEEKLTFVPKHHFRNLCMIYGISAGIVFSSVFSSFDFMGIGIMAGVGLSMGTAIGIVFGTSLDQKAEKEGRQLKLVAAEY